jgi:hypothetical protein
MGTLSGMAKGKNSKAGWLMYVKQTDCNAREKAKDNLQNFLCASLF